MDLFLAIVPNSLPLFSSSRICFASFSVLTTMTRSKTSSRPLDCALEIVDELNDRNRIGTIASISHRVCKSEIVFLAVWFSTAVVDALELLLVTFASVIALPLRATPLRATVHLPGESDRRARPLGLARFHSASGSPLCRPLPQFPVRSARAYRSMKDNCPRSSRFGTEFPLKSSISLQRRSRLGCCGGPPSSKSANDFA